MQRKIVFFINPISGARSKHDLEQKIISKCEKENTPFELLFTNAEGDYHFLPEKIIKENITDVVICGGDGSLAPIISFLLDSSVNVGIIPLGSGNGLARTAGIPYHVDKAIDIIFSGKAHPVDAFKVNERIGCQITGLGFDAYVAAEFAKERKRGLTTYTKLAVKHFFGARPYSFSLSCDGNPLDTKAFIVCVSNANQFGNNLKIAPRASLQDGKLDVVILNKTSKVQILASFVNHLLFTKTPDQKEWKETKRKISYFHCQKVTIQNKDNAPVHIDGDPMEPVKELEIKILPEAFKLIHPV